MGQTTQPPSEHPPREVKPPRKPANQNLQIGLTVGIDVLAFVNYHYRTSVTLPNGQEFQYAGTNSAPGFSLAGAADVTLPGALRRVTVGGVVRGGGLYTTNRSVVPSGADAPFSVPNLQDAIRLQHPFGEGWNTSVSPHIEHDIYSFGDNKLRLGYQYERQTGSYNGIFYQGILPGVTGAYHVDMKYQSHLVRFSWSNYAYLDSAADRKVGLLRQMGICVGTSRTILIFFAIGPVWSL